MEELEVVLKEKNDRYLKVLWNHPDWGFGELTAIWNGKRWVVDAEYLGIEKTSLILYKSLWL